MRFRTVVMVLLGFLLGDCIGNWFTDRVQEDRITELESHVSALETPKMDIYEQALHVILWAESRNGLMPNLDVPGPNGELGSWQVTPVWIADIKRLTGETVNPMDKDNMRRQAKVWLKHYGPRVGAETVEDLRQLYRRGPTGYRRWKGE